MRDRTPYEHLTIPYRRAAAVAFGVMQEGRAPAVVDREYKDKCKQIAAWIDATFDTTGDRNDHRAAVRGACDYIDSELTQIMD